MNIRATEIDIYRPAVWDIARQQCQKWYYLYKMEYIIVTGILYFIYIWYAMKVIQLWYGVIYALVEQLMVIMSIIMINMIIMMIVIIVIIIVIIIIIITVMFISMILLMITILIVRPNNYYGQHKTKYTKFYSAVTVW